MGCVWNAVLYPTLLLCTENHSPWDFSVTLMGSLGQENYSRENYVEKTNTQPLLFRNSQFRVSAYCVDSAGLEHTELTHNYLKLVDIK